MSFSLTTAFLIPIALLWGILFLPQFISPGIPQNDPSSASASSTTPTKSALSKVWDWSPRRTKNWRKIQLWYFRWRLRKPNASPADRDRTADFVLKLVSDAAKTAGEQQHGTGVNTAGAKLIKAASVRPMDTANVNGMPDYLKPLNYVLGGALHDFCSETETAEQADRILKLVYRAHSPMVDRVIVTRLIDCFETTSPDIRSRIQQALVLLVEDYSDVKPPPLMKRSTGDPSRTIQLRKSMAAPMLGKRGGCTNLVEAPSQSALVKKQHLR